MFEDHSAFRENIPAYALGALDAEEAASLEAHLGACETCRQELADYRLVSQNLAAALPPRPPSPALRRRLQERISPARKTSPLRWSLTLGQAAVGIALLLLLGINFYSLAQMRQLQRQQAALLRQARNYQAAVAMLSYPDTQSLVIQGQEVAGTLLLNREHNTVILITWDLPALPESQTYQAWLIDPSGGRVSAGTFRPGSEGSYTTATLWPEENLSAYTGLGVTVEPAGGSPQPTGQRLFKVDF
jgi:anti-sigma-K factor RskA